MSDMTSEKIARDGAPSIQTFRTGANGADSTIGGADNVHSAPAIRLAGLSAGNNPQNRLDPNPARRAGVSMNETGQSPILHVGKGVKLNGKISSCGVLTVEGDVEAKVTARMLQIAKDASFEGTAIVEEAEIDGRFNGTLQVSGKLTVRRGARLTGRLSYGQLEVEPGAEIRGQLGVQFGSSGKKGHSSTTGMRGSWPFGRNFS
jgi:cytoskeletal protein CcmA (bactofilin family)